MELGQIPEEELGVESSILVKCLAVLVLNVLI
jgi:hypothetical protein